MAGPQPVKIYADVDTTLNRVRLDPVFNQVKLDPANNKVAIDPLSNTVTIAGGGLAGTVKIDPTQNVVSLPPNGNTVKIDDTVNTVKIDPSSVTPVEVRGTPRVAIQGETPVRITNTPSVQVSGTVPVSGNVGIIGNPYVAISPQYNKVKIEGTVPVRMGVNTDSLMDCRQAGTPSSKHVLAAVTLTSGTYNIDIYTQFHSDTPSVNDWNNFEVRYRGNLLTILPSGRTNGTNKFSFRYTVGGSAVMDVETRYQGSTDSFYSCMIVADKVS